MPSSRRAAPAPNPNHHLWQHGKAWGVYCAVTPTRCTKDKLRRSLATGKIEVARFRRLDADGLLRRLPSLGMPWTTPPAPSPA